MSTSCSPFLKAVVWVLGFIVEPNEQLTDLSQTELPMTDPAIMSCEMSDLYEIRRRRWLHSSTARRHWWEQYGTESPPASPSTIMWASDGKESPVTRVASLNDIDTILFKDTTPPVSYYATVNMKSLLKNNK
jgi:hypothetical protein